MTPDRTRSGALRHTGRLPQWVGAEHTPERTRGAQSGAQSAFVRARSRQRVYSAAQGTAAGHIRTHRTPAAHTNRQEMAMGIETDPDRWLSERETAALLGLSVGTVRRYRRAGIGPAWSRLGTRLVRYRRADVIAWARAQSANRQDVA